jgi:hypothetical protein
VALLSTNHKCTHPCLLLLRIKRCEAVEDGVDARRTQPQSIACGVGASVSRIELYNSDRFCKFCLCSLRDAVTAIHFCLLYV